MFGTIYALAEPGTDNIRYCGKTTRKLGKRLEGHRRDARLLKGRHLYHWLSSVYSSGAEPKQIICETIPLEGLPHGEQLRLMNEAERRWIAQLRILGFDLTNATNGGDGTHGRIVSAETRAKTGAKHRGKVMSPEARALIRAAQLARDPATFVRGEKHPNFGKKWVYAKEPERVEKILAAWDAEKRSAHGGRYRGAKNSRAKITNEIAAQIFLATGTLEKVAETFGVSLKIVWDIKAQKTWVHATAELGESQPRKGQCVLTAEKAVKVFLAKGKAKDIAAKFGIAVNTVYQIKNGKTWREHTSKYSMKEGK